MRTNVDRSLPVLHVGMDIGHCTTVISTSHFCNAEDVTTRVFPTCLAYRLSTERRPQVLLGEDAIASRNELEIVYPLESKQPRVFFDFARALRAAIDPGYRYQLWGVVHVSSGVTSGELRTVRRLAHEVFDRTRLVDGPVLAARCFDAREVENDFACVDLGTASIRVTPVHSGAPIDDRTMVVPGGGAAVKKRLRVNLLKRFPSFPLSDRTVQGVQERFGHFRPVDLSCRLRVRTEEGDRVEDISSLVSRACEPLIEEIVEGLRRALMGYSENAVTRFLNRVQLVGAAAATPGLQARLEAAARKEFQVPVTVRLPEHPGRQAASNALEAAHALHESEWGKPAFSFAS